nr:MAG TPA: hypothetical protein [Bacteriophage sp.]
MEFPISPELIFAIFLMFYTDFVESLSLFNFILN